MSDYEDCPAQGMSKREEFTKAAMAAILSNPALTNESNFKLGHYPSDLAMIAIGHADAALQKLEDFK
jgi:uncharacterized FAD-dependent dehydrogenase